MHDKPPGIENMIEIPRQQQFYIIFTQARVKLLAVSSFCSHKRLK
jgi:hypothetical protein